MFSKVVDGVDSFFMWLNSAIKQNVADYCDLETADDMYSLVAKDGSLMTVVRIDGYRSLINAGSFYKNISAPFASGLSSLLKKKGHAIQFWFSSDPSKSEKLVRDALTPSYETIRRLNLDLKEILDERVENISKRASTEECYIVLWTTSAVLMKNDLKQEVARKRKMRNETMVSAIKYSQDPFAANGALKSMHKSFVDSVVDLLVGTIGMSAEMLDVRTALREIRRSLDSDYMHPNWEAFLPGDSITPNVKKFDDKKEEWDIIWPKLNWQVCQQEAEIVTNRFVRIGDYVYAPGYMDLFPKDILPFSSLFNSLGSSIPWRISFFIEGDGLSGIAFKGLMASILALVSGNNKLLNEGVKFVREISNDHTLVKARVSFCTWVHKSRQSELDSYIAELSRAVEGWGNSIVSEVTGDPLAGVMSSSLAVSKSSIATPSAVPIEALSFMLPFTRPSSAWSRGSVLLLSPDNKLMPYQPGSSEQISWIQLIFAKPGSGKSVLMNITNLALCLAPGIERLPRIGIVDIGPASSGLISLLKESLPVDKRHLAQSYKLRMTEEFCVNPWDTQLGCRYPTSSERAFLNNFLLLLATDPNVEVPEKGLTGLVQAIVDDMYFKTSDRGSPKKYDSGVNRDVDIALEEIGFKSDFKTTWWEVVDRLFVEGKIHEATLAQRYAVPILSDASSSAQDEKIKEIYSKVTVSTGENLVEYFNRSITDALGQYKILGKPTVFDIGETRVVSLDLDEVAKTGGAMADRQTAVMYMLARYILAKDFKLGTDTINEMPYPPNLATPPEIPTDKYKAYHKVRIEEIMEDFKRLCFDEFHRTSKSKVVREQIIVDMREGRKWNVDVTLASQDLKDFDETMKSLATGIFIMDSGNERDIEEIISTFGMDDEAERYALSKGHVRGPRGGGPGVFMAKFFTNKGKYTQLLSAYIGAMEMWALSTTSEDVAVRNRLYELIGPANARRILAREYPYGIKKAVEIRKERMRANNDFGFIDDEKGLYDQIVQEILTKSGFKGRD